MDSFKLNLFRRLAKIFSSKIFNIIIFNYSKDRYGWHLEFENKLYYYFHWKVYDYIDYIYGPSESAELSAQRTGYWNLEIANDFLHRFPKEDWKILAPFVYKIFQVKKY